MLPPRWFRLRLGPFLRRELDKRMYHRLFRTVGPLALASRTARLLVLPHRDEPRQDESPSHEPGIYIFRGMNGFFAPLLGNHDILRSALISSVRPEYVRSPPTSRGIAIHVRRGDFSSEGSEKQLREGHANLRIPTEWYVRALRALRAALPMPIPAVVFSDGHSQELSELLAEPDTRRHEHVSAVTDMLSMSDAAALIGSASTFSRWATFLGQVPSVWHPGHGKETLLVGAAAAEVSPEWERGPLSPAFLASVLSRL